MADLIVYDLAGISQVNKVKFGRDMFGYMDSSGKGKYKYDRKGLVDEAACFRFSENVVACRTSRDTREVLELLKKFGIKYKKYRVSISSSEFK